VLRRCGPRAAQEVRELLDEHTPRRSRPSARSRVTPLGVLALVLLVIIVVLAAANSQKVTVDFVFEDYEVPLAVVIAGTGLIGLVVGWLLGRFGVMSWLLDRYRKP
jgi:uncharacterized integral membrane protein